MRKIANLKKLLKKHSVKFTKSREIILKYLLKKGAHKSAENIYKNLRKHSPHLGRATIFRNIKLFEKLGLISRFSQSKFEAKTGKKHHDHMLCLKCGAVVEFSNPVIEKLQQKEAKKRNFTSINHTLEIKGYCSKCKDKK